MGILEDIVQQIMGGQDVQNTITQENPYLEAQAPVNQIGQVIQSAAGTGKYGLGELGVGSAVTGLLSGLLGGAGRNYQSTLTSRYNDTLAKLQAGEAVTADSANLPASIFQKADTSARLFKKVQELQAASEEKKILDQVKLQTNPKLLEAGFLQQAVSSGTMTAEEAAAKMKASTGAGTSVGVSGPGVENVAAGSSVPTSIESYAKARGVKLPEGVPATRQMVDALALDKEKKDAIAKGLEKTTYDRIAALPEYKMLADVDSNFKALPDLARQDTKAGDIGLFSTVARIRDPNSVVMPGEYKINAETQAYLDSVYGDWRSVITGKSRLDANAKKAIILSVVPKYNELVKAYSGRSGSILEALTAEGGNATNIPVPKYELYDPASVDSIFPKKLKASDLIAQGYKQTPQGWVK